MGNKPFYNLKEIIGYVFLLSGLKSPLKSAHLSETLQSRIVIECGRLH